MTPEGKVKERVKRILRTYNVYWHMPMQSGMGEPSLDFVCCAGGKYVAIETKAAGKKPTARQLQTIARMQAAGAWVFVVSDEASLAVLEASLALLTG